VASAIYAAQFFGAWSECRVQNHWSVDWTPNSQCFAYRSKYYSAGIARPIRRLETQPPIFSPRWLVVDLMFHDDGAEYRYIIASFRAFNNRSVVVVYYLPKLGVGCSAYYYNRVMAYYRLPSRGVVRGTCEAVGERKFSIF
jgi:hypothetical protein